jgi:hypothetical protein
MTEPLTSAPPELRETGPVPVSQQVTEDEDLAARERAQTRIDEKKRRYSEEGQRETKGREATPAQSPPELRQARALCKVVSCSPVVRSVCKDGDAYVYIPPGWVRMVAEEHCARETAE